MRDSKRHPPGPPPGSPDAAANGCICSAEDNANGRGAIGLPDAWMLDIFCELHGRESEWRRWFDRRDGRV